MLNLLLRRILPILTISLLVQIVAASVLGQSLEAGELVYVSQHKRIGEQQLNADQITWQAFVNWSPDGQRLIFTIPRGRDRTVPELWLIDLSNLETETPRLVLKEEDLIEIRAIWLNDGQIGIYGVSTQLGNPHPFIVLTLETEEIEQIEEIGSLTERVAWSSQDRSTLLYLGRIPSNDGDPVSYQISTLDVLNAETHQLADVVIGGLIAEVHWSKNESYVAVTTVSHDMLVIRLEDGHILQSTQQADQPNRLESNVVWRP